MIKIYETIQRDPIGLDPYMWIAKGIAIGTTDDNDIVIARVDDRGWWISNIIIDHNTKEISSVYCDTNYRRLGYTKELIKIAINMYHMKYIKVYKDNNAAINLYKSLGFKITGDTYDNKMYTMEYED